MAPRDSGMLPGRVREPRTWHHRKAAILCTVFFLAPAIFAQDTHYWNLFYGTEATLLGGTVIGSASDLSATYYNPGMLAVNREKGLLLGANVYTYQRYSVQQSTAEDVVNGRIAPAPGLIAGRIPVDSSAIGGIAYSILTRQSMESVIEARFVGPADVTGSDGTPEQLSSNLTLNSGLSDTWLGVTLFRLLDPQIGFGFTNYVAIRNQRTRSTANGQALPADGTSLASASRIADVEYDNIRLLWKLGVGVNLDPLTLGLTVTTPSVNLFGSGSMFLSYGRNYPEAGGDSTQKIVLIATNQEKLDSRYNTSWAVGIGMGYRFGNARIHFSAEWYAAVPLFKVIETQSFAGQSDGKSHSVEITDERQSVVNAGLGAQYTLSPSVALFGSLVTDFSYVPDGTTSNLSLTPWDLLHVSFGTVLSFSLLDITAGFSFAGGSASLADVPWASVGASLGKVIGISSESEIKYFSATGILAFTFKL
jgi:hypothetical protein